jgi:hypothetical protein
MIKWIEASSKEPELLKVVLVCSKFDGFGLAYRSEWYPHKWTWLDKRVNGASGVRGILRWADVIPDVIWCDAEELAKTLPTEEAREG